MRAIDPTPVLIFDLDGTILRTNSFPRWVLFLLIGRLPKLRLNERGLLSLRVVHMLLRRKLGRLDHEALQQHLTLVWRSAVEACGPAVTDRLNAKLLRRIRRNLRPLLDLVATQRLDAVLATAAAAAYAEGFGRTLGFHHVLAGNSADRKCLRVLGLLRDHGWCHRSLILFTDHEDDLPLIRESDTVCWFGSPRMLAAVRASARDVHFIWCRDMDRRALNRTVLQLSGGDQAAIAGSRPASPREMIVS